MQGTRLVAALLLLILSAPPADSRKRQRAPHHGRPDGTSTRPFIEDLPDGCGGRQSTDADIFDFFQSAVAGRLSRLEIQDQADWIITDLELGCTPGMAAEPEVFEKLQCVSDGLSALLNRLFSLEVVSKVRIG